MMMDEKGMRPSTIAFAALGDGWYLKESCSIYAFVGVV